MCCWWLIWGFHWHRVFFFSLFGLPHILFIYKDTFIQLQGNLFQKFSFPSQYPGAKEHVREDCICRDGSEQLQGKTGDSPEAAVLKKITKQSLPTFFCLFQLAAPCPYSHTALPTGQPRETSQPRGIDFWRQPKIDVQRKSIRNWMNILWSFPVNFFSQLWQRKSQLRDRAPSF